MDVQLIDRLSATAAHAPERTSWPTAVDAGESGAAAHISPKAQEMITKYRQSVRSPYSSFFKTLYIFAMATLWHQEKDKKHTVDEIRTLADNDDGFFNKISDYFYSKNERTRMHLLIWGFNQLHAQKWPYTRAFRTNLTAFLIEAAKLPSSVKHDMRLIDKNVDGMLKFFVDLANDMKDSKDLKNWKIFHRK